MPKYNVGQIFRKTYGRYLTCEIVYVSPEKDYEGSYAYFVKVTDSNKDTWYDVRYEDHIEDWVEVK